MSSHGVYWKNMTISSKNISGLDPNAHRVSEIKSSHWIYRIPGRLESCIKKGVEGKTENSRM